jgi:hypothetical protein
VHLRMFVLKQRLIAAYHAAAIPALAPGADAAGENLPPAPW